MPPLDWTSNIYPKQSAPGSLGVCVRGYGRAAMVSFCTYISCDSAIEIAAKSQQSCVDRTSTFSIPSVPRTACLSFADSTTVHAVFIACPHSFISATRDIDMAIPPVRLAVCPWHSGVVSKRLNIPSKFFHYWIAPRYSSFLTTNRCNQIQTSSLKGPQIQEGCENSAIFGQ